MRTDPTLLHPWTKHRSIGGGKNLLTMLLSLLLICYSYDAVSDSSQHTGLAAATSVTLPQEEKLQTAPAQQTVNKPKTRRSRRTKLTQSGKASWYGPGFHGKPTASGDVFDQALMTAAHNTFPLGSRAKVTNLANGNSVEVKINDRGPYADGRIIDLSRAAARALGILESGIAQVRVEVLPVSTG